MTEFDLNKAHFKYFDESHPDELYFMIRPMPKHIARQILEKGERKRVTSTKFTKKFDSEAMAQDRIEYVLIGWEGLKKRHLIDDILDVDMADKWKAKFKDISLEDDIPYDEEMKELVVLYHSGDFLSYVGQCQENIVDLIKDGLKKESKN